MALGIHRNTVTRSWGRLLCHSFAALTSCFSMIKHGPMSQGSVHNSWKVKMSQFFHCLHTHQTCHPLSMFGMFWIDVFDSVFQFLPISSNFSQPLKRSGTTFHRPQSTAWSTLCEGHVLRWMRQMVVTPDTDWCSDLPPYLFFKGICDQQMRICIPSHVKAVALCQTNVFQLTDFLIGTVTQ